MSHANPLCFDAFDTITITHKIQVKRTVYTSSKYTLFYLCMRRRFMFYYIVFSIRKNQLATDLHMLCQI